MPDGRHDDILVLPALFIGALSMIRPCEFSPSQWGLSNDTEELRIGQAACAIQKGGVRMTSVKTTVISNTCLCLPQPSLVSQHFGVFPVAVETSCVLKHCGNTWHTARNPSHHFLKLLEREHYQLILLCTKYITSPNTLSDIVPHRLSLNSIRVFVWSPHCPSLSLNEVSVFGFKGWYQSAFRQAADIWALLFLPSRVRDFTDLR